MDKTFTLLQFLSLPPESLTEEDLDQLSDELPGKQLISPKDSIISFILNYARSTDMICSEQTGRFGCCMN